MAEILGDYHWTLNELIIRTDLDITGNCLISGTNIDSELFPGNAVWVDQQALTLSKLWSDFRKFMSPRTRLEGPQKSSIFFPAKHVGIR